MLIPLLKHVFRSEEREKQNKFLRRHWRANQFHFHVLPRMQFALTLFEGTRKKRKNNNVTSWRRTEIKEEKWVANTFSRQLFIKSNDWHVHTTSKSHQNEIYLDVSHNVRILISTEIIKSMHIAQAEDKCSAHSFCSLCSSRGIFVLFTRKLK